MFEKLVVQRNIYPKTDWSLQSLTAALAPLLLLGLLGLLGLLAPLASNRASASTRDTELRPGSRPADVFSSVLPHEIRSRVQTSGSRDALRSRVDSEHAAIYLSWLLDRSAQNKKKPLGALPRDLALLDREAASSTLGRDAWTDLTTSYSTDLATLLFARSILAKPENAQLQAIFTTELARLRDRTDPRQVDATDGPTVLFVPGFLYRSHPETGGDFAIPRHQLTAVGMSNRLIETDESGSVEDNAKRIAAAVRESENQRILIVSASKGGPEVAHAVGRLLEPEETRSVVAWINIGGLLGGTPLADQALLPPRRWLVRAALWWKNLRSDGIRSLRTLESRRRLADLSLPPDLPIINVVPTPLSGNLSKRAEDGYNRLRKLGPNDGLALLPDQVLPGTRTLLLLGDDHFLTRQSPRDLTLALLHTAGHLIEARRTDVGIRDHVSDKHQTIRLPRQTSAETINAGFARPATPPGETQ